MSKDFWRAIAIVLLLVAVGQHYIMARSINALGAVLDDIEETARMQNGWVYIELSD